MKNCKLQTAKQNQNSKSKLWLLGFCGLLLGFLALASGCGERYESTAYYYSPNWTRGGDILFTYGLNSVRKDAIGTQLGSTYTESVNTMTAAGASRTFIFDVTNAPPYAVSPAPTSDYIAYLDGLDKGLFGKIVTHNISATSPHRGLETAELLFSPGIKSFDWSNNSLQFVYCTTTEVRVRDWNDYTGTTDTLVTAETSLECVAWKYGAKIAFIHNTTAGKVLSLIKADGTARVDLAVAASVNKPQISPLGTNVVVYGLNSGGYCSVDTSAASPALTVILASCAADLPRLNAAGDKVVYDKAGQTSGIYVLDLGTKTESQIK